MPLHPAPETLQITTLFVVPLTVAKNCNWPPGTTSPGLGDRDTEIAAKADAFRIPSRSRSHETFNKRFMVFASTLQRSDLEPSELLARMHASFGSSFQHAVDQVAIVQLA